MFGIRYANETDKPFWFTLDSHLNESELDLKIRDKRGFIITDKETSIGVMRYNLFWDNTPFLTMIHLEEAAQGKGFGKKAMAFWENEMRELGYKVVMTSTQVDEQAQHFYRKLDYIEKGSLTFDNTPYEQPMEMLLIKVL